MRRERGELGLLVVGRLRLRPGEDSGRLGCLGFGGWACFSIFRSTAILTADDFHAHIDPLHRYAAVAQRDEIARVLHGHNGSDASDSEDVSLFDGVRANEREWGRIGKDDVTDRESRPVGAGFAAYGDNVNGRARCQMRK